jgi:hypothetical protein
MPLLTYTPLTKTIPLGENSFVVRGLSLDEISILVQSNIDGVEEMFTQLEIAIDQTKKKTMDEAGMKSLALNLIRTVPSFASAAIALAIDEEGSYQDKLRASSRLPAPVQIDALLQIGSLTFEEAGGVKKFSENLGAMWGKLKPPPAIKSEKVRSSASTKA